MKAFTKALGCRVELEHPDSNVQTAAASSNAAAAAAAAASKLET